MNCDFVSMGFKSNPVVIVDNLALLFGFYSVILNYSTNKLY